MIKFDEFGPEKLIEVYDPATGLHGFLVIDNTILGPGKGGLRITPTVTMDEVANLARVMTYKCSLAELPFGGGKSGIQADTKNLSKAKKFELVRSFAKAIKRLTPGEYIAGPDVGAGEAEMAEFVKAIRNLEAATGKPEKMAGLPHELGSTGFGVTQATKVAGNFAKILLKGATVALSGFGSVGQHTASYLSEIGAKIVAVSDSTGTVYEIDGINIERLLRVKGKFASVTKYGEGKILKAEEIFRLNVDILIPAALGGVINSQNVEKIQAKIIVEGANLPVTEEAEEILHQKGVLVIPDIVANVGGVLSSYAEFKGLTKGEMFKLVKKKVLKITSDVLEKAAKEKISPRKSALGIARARLKLKVNEG